MSDMEHKHDQHMDHSMNDNMQSHKINHDMHAEHMGHDMAEHSMHDKHMNHSMEGGHAEHGEHAHHADHTGHEQMFRSRFWGSLLLSIPVLVFSPTLQGWLGFSVPSFTGSNWIPFIFALIVFVYGGIPFIKMAVPEVQNREPGMMTSRTVHRFDGTQSW